jgi:hypothetical protein
MADVKISAATAVVTPAGADEFATNQGGASKRTTLAQIKTFANTAPVWAAGSTSAGSWPTLGSGTLLTTPEAGAMERDANCIYLTSDAGNRGVVPIVHFIRCNATRTLPNDTNTNPIFNSPTNGRITLETGTYLFEMMAIVTAMSATSGNAFVNILGAGTATVGAWLWRFSGIDNTTPGSSVDDDSQYLVVANSAVLAAATGTAMRFQAKGTFEVTAAGTLIPSIDQVTAAAAIVSIGSFFMCYRIGSDAVVSVGQWD